VRGKLVAFRNLYSFMGQIIPFHDPELEKLYAFGRMLLRKLPRPEGDGRWEPGEDVVLASLKLKKEAEGDLGLQKGEGGELTGPSATGTSMVKMPKEKLSTIIEVLNNRFGLDLPEHTQKVLDGVEDGLAGREDIRLAARANDAANFGHVFSPALKRMLVDHHAENGQLVDMIFSDERVMRTVDQLMRERVYGRLAKEETR